MERYAYKIVLLLSERYPDIIDSLYDGGAYLWTAKQADLNYCTQIDTDKYLGHLWVIRVR